MLRPPGLWRAATDQVAPFFLESCEAAGIELTDDFNKPGGRTGAGYYDFNVRNGVRDSAARAMLGEIITGKDPRSNLDVLTEAHVDRVLLERKAVRCIARDASRTLPILETPSVCHDFLFSITDGEYSVVRSTDAGATRF